MILPYGLEVMDLNSKERVKIALSHKEPDCVPVFASYVPVINKQLTDKYSPKKELGVMMGNDMIKTVVGMETSYHASDDPEYTCKWGLRWRNVKNYTGEYTEIIDHPLAGDDSKLVSYTIPDPQEEAQYSYVREIVSTYGKEKWIIGSCQCSIFESAWYLRGLDQFMMDMAINEDYANELLDKVMQFPLQSGLKMIELGVDMVWLGDDVATQTNMMISPNMWREYLKPRYAHIFSEFKKKNKDIKIAYHSCGNCEAIIDEMAEIGLDVLNPIQPAAMNVQTIKEKYGHKISLFGGLDVQHILPFGSNDDVKKEVKRLIEICSKDGGYILSPAHHIQSDTSIDNIEAFYQAAREYGKYK
jgi:uroporphyrinogen decarboxylase